MRFGYYGFLLLFILGFMVCWAAINKFSTLEEVSCENLPSDVVDFPKCYNNLPPDSLMFLGVGLMLVSIILLILTPYVNIRSRYKQKKGG